MGSSSPSTGMKPSPTAAREPAMKSQYLKKNSRARLNTTEEATASFAPRRLPLLLQRVTSMPWV